METLSFFRLRFRREYDSAYDFRFQFSLGCKLSFDFDSVASENQPLILHSHLARYVDTPKSWMHRTAWDSGSLLPVSLPHLEQISGTSSPPTRFPPSSSSPADVRPLLPLVPSSAKTVTLETSPKTLKSPQQQTDSVFSSLLEVACGCNPFVVSSLLVSFSAHNFNISQTFLTMSSFRVHSQPRTHDSNSRDLTTSNDGLSRTRLPSKRKKNTCQKRGTIVSLIALPSDSKI